MTDFQLDEIERLAVMWVASASDPAMAGIEFGPKFNPAFFLPGGLYYEMRRLPKGLFDAIKHGDREHQDWLKQAIEDYFAGRQVQRPRGKGL